MKYKSKKGTVINIPDGLTDKQVKAIKADADAGYGTRAQQTANQLGQQKPQTGGGATTGINQKVTDANRAKVIAELEKREKSGKIGKNDAKRLAALRAGAADPGTPADAPPVTTPDPAAAVTDFPNPGGVIPKGVVDPETGVVDPVGASDAVAEAETGDINTNFDLEHPRTITDQNGNKRIITKHADGTVTVEDQIGGTAKTFRDLATAAAETFNGSVSRKSAYDAEFRNRTQYLDRNQGREEENAKQEMANRGIPYDPASAYDPNSKNLYGRTIGGIKQNYQGQYADAADRATLAGNQAYAVDASARDSFLGAVTSGASQFGGNFGQYSNTVTTDQSQDTKDILALTVDQIMTKYGIDRAEATARFQSAQANKNKGGGSGGGTSGGSSGGAGFEIIG